MHVAVKQGELRRARQLDRQCARSGSALSAVHLARKTNQESTQERERSSSSRQTGPPRAGWVGRYAMASPSPLPATRSSPAPSVTMEMKERCQEASASSPTYTC